MVHDATLQHIIIYPRLLLESFASGAGRYISRWMLLFVDGGGSGFSRGLLYPFIQCGYGP